MVKVNYIPPSNIRDQLLRLRPYRDELCRLMRYYRFSSAEYRRLTAANAALDDVCELLAGNRELLWIQIPRSQWKPDAG